MLSSSDFLFKEITLKLPLFIMKSEPLARHVSPSLPATALLLLYCIAGAAGSIGNVTLSMTPPRGWNSYDSFSWIISEDEFLQNAEYVAANLLEYGYEYVVVDFLWYRKHEPGASVTTRGYDIIDDWGRPVPDPARWPSTRGGKGFKPIADKVHAMGLKFGIHVMRGISTAAVESNSPILCAEDCTQGIQGRNWTAKDITVPGGECSWMWDCFIKVNTSTVGGRAFINSLYQQYAEWEVDLIKHDCVFGVYDMSVDEITAVGEAIESTGRPILYSLSPGVSATPEMGKQVAHLAHMYRITSDDWDSWWDVLSHFPVARDFAAAGLIGARGLGGAKSWPDMDMLPIGWLTDPGATYGPYRPTSLSKDEQMTQITLWAMAKSPLMFGGDLRNIDQWTFELISQPTVLGINAHSTHNRELSSSVESSLPDVTLEDCITQKFTQWKLENSKDGKDELCWSRLSKPRYSEARQRVLQTGCLNWRDVPQSVPYLNPMSEEHRARSGEVWSPTSEEVCLDWSGLWSNDTEKKSAFSDCNGRSIQVWHLTSDGRLASNEGAFCVVVKLSTSGWKVWVSRGSEGQSYVAFFNLGSERMEISVPVEDVLNHVNSIDPLNANVSMDQLPPWLDWLRMDLLLGSKKSSPWSCTGLDIWSNTQFTANMTELKAWVESHGTVLFELRCEPLKGAHSCPRLLWYFVALCVLLVGLLAHHYPAARRPWSTYGLLSVKEDATSLAEEKEEARLAMHNQKRGDVFAAL